MEEQQTAVIDYSAVYVIGYGEHKFEDIYMKNERFFTREEEQLCHR